MGRYQRTSVQLSAEYSARLPNGVHLGMGRRVPAGDLPIMRGRHDLAALYDHRAEPVVPLAQAGLRLPNGKPHLLYELHAVRLPMLDIAIKYHTTRAKATVDRGFFGGFTRTRQKRRESSRRHLPRPRRMYAISLGILAAEVYLIMVSRKSVITFGMVAIPIAMYTATQDNDIHFNQLHGEDGGRIRYKKTCAHCGQEITSGDIVKGYEYDKDQYVVVTDEEIEKIKTEKEKSIQILHFAQLNQISPVYYDKTYQAAPETGGEKAFELLRAALMAEQKIAIGKTVIGTRDTLMAIIPREDGILISTMLYADEVRAFEKRYDKPAVAEPELNMAKLLINSMDTPFTPAKYKDEYQGKLRALIETKISGKEVVAAEPQKPGKIIDLMEALKASVERAKSEKRPA